LAAAGQVARIVEAAATLSEFPQSGRPGRRSGTRELVVVKTPFLVAYRVRGDLIEILRVLQGARRWPSRL
jgi:toxin ParE1/3/4